MTSFRPLPSVLSSYLLAGSKSSPIANRKSEPLKVEPAAAEASDPLSDPRDAALDDARTRITQLEEELGAAQIALASQAEAADAAKVSCVPL